MRFARFLLTMSAFWTACVGAQNLRLAEGRGACATDEELVIRGINLQDNRSSVRKKIGNPLSMTKGISEDDGGEYETVAYIYKNLEVVFGRSGVERITASNPKIKTARGITVGMTESQVGERLGFATGTETGPFEVRLAACRPPGLAELHLVFAPRAPNTNTAVLAEITVTNYGP